MGRSERGARGSATGASSVEFLAPRIGAFVDGSAGSAPGADLARQHRDHVDHRDHSDRGDRGDRGDHGDHGDDRNHAARRAVDGAVARDGSGGGAGLTVAGSDEDGRDDQPTSRRSGVVAAGIAVLTLVALGVAVDPWAGDERSTAPLAPAATESPATSAPSAAPAQARVVAAEPGEEAVLTGGYLLDPLLLPDGWRSSGGLSPMVGARAGGRSGNGWLELWATPGASRTTGRWFAVQYRPGDQHVVQDAARIELGDRIGMMSTTADGVSSISYPAVRATATITWFGWELPDVVELTRSVRFARSGRPRFDDPAVRAEHTMLLSRSSFGVGLEQDLFMTDVVSTAGYRQVSAEGAPALVDITSREADAELDTVLARFVLGDAVAHDGAGQLRLPIGASAVLAGDVHYAPASAPQDLHVLQWTVGARTVHLSTTLPPDELRTTFPLGLIGPGTVGAWQRQLLGVARTAFDERRSVDLGTGTLADGGAWELTIIPEFGWVYAWVSSADRSQGATIGLDLGVRPCATAASADVTTIICVRAAERGAASLSIEAGGGTQDVMFEALGHDARWLGVVHQFDAPGAFRASIIGPDGTTTPAIAAGLPSER